MTLIVVLFAGCTPQTNLPAAVPTGSAPTLSTTLHPTATVDTSPTSNIPTATTPSATTTPLPDGAQFFIGLSVEGRPIWGRTFGSGEALIVLVGGIHGGYEGNSITLMEQLIEHFIANPADILPGVQLVIIPSANPDGAAAGSGPEGRVNARDVDLNRNWGCDWSPTAAWSIFEISPGPEPFSEPETQALRAYFLERLPDTVVFYHSSYGGVFLGACGAAHPPADWLGDLLEDATGYPYETFDHYDVTGDATNWLAERDVPAAIIELTTQEETEFERNLAGVQALQCHFAVEDDPATEDACGKNR